jgi:tRNA G46 methylase TrmB
MSDPAPPRRENPNTYFVQDRSSEEEAHRLQVQDRMTTAGMGGVLPEQTDPTIFRRVLDVGCGTGWWLIEAAKTYPSMSLLIG